MMQGRKVLILGSAGMLGSELQLAAEGRAASVTAVPGPEEVDLTDPDAVSKLFSETQPSIVLNAAAYTNVDGAETDRDAAHAGNHLIPKYLAEQTASHEALLVHYSTDYIFRDTWDSPIPVDAEKGPTNVYGETKLAGEEAIIESGCEHLILRTSWLFAKHGNNFVRTIHKLATERDELKVVDDQRGRPTYCPDLAEMTCQLIEANARGIYHTTNDGECSWFEFAQAIVEFSHIDSCHVVPCSTDAFPRPAKRPAYSVLDISRTTAIIGDVRHWPDALKESLAAG